MMTAPSRSSVQPVGKMAFAAGPTGRRTALTINKTDSRARRAPHQKGRKPAPGPKVALDGIRRDPSISAREKIKTIQPVI
jgi:hypothetical protein